jgi:hypothetical protein
MPKVASIEHPLELRGIVLRADSGTFVIAAIDYCGICNTSDETIRDAMARAAGTTRERVALHVPLVTRFVQMQSSVRQPLDQVAAASIAAAVREAMSFVNRRC